MRRSSVMMMGILVLACGALLVGANMLLGTVETDARLAQELTNLLAQREDIADGSRVQALRRPAGNKTLATEGKGVVVVLEPSTTVKSRRGGMQALLGIVVRETANHFRGRHVDWVELHLRLEGAEADPFRTVLHRSGDQFGVPQPSIPGI